MKLSARNILKGKIVDVTKGQTTAHVRIDIGGAVITSSITNEAVDELKLKPGMAALAVIKSSDVMVAVLKTPPTRGRRSTTGGTGRCAPRWNLGDVRRPLTASGWGR